MSRVEHQDWFEVYHYPEDVSRYIRQLENLQHEYSGSREPSFPEIVDALRSKKVICFIGMPAAGKSTLRKETERAAKIIFPDNPFFFIELLHSEAILTKMEAMGGKTTDIFTPRDWIDFSDAFETKRRTITEGIKKVPCLVKAFVEIYGQPSSWKSSTTNLLQGIIQESIADIDPDNPDKPEKVMLLYERSFFAGHPRNVANDGIRLLAADMQNSKDTKLFVLYQDVGNFDLALDLRVLARQYINDCPKLEKILQEKYPYIITDGVDIKEFAKSLIRTASPRVLQANFQGIREAAHHQLKFLRQYSSEGKLFNSYIWRELQNRYEEILDPIDQFSRRLIDAYIKWMIKDVYGCKDATFVYNQHSEEPLYVGDE